MASSTPSPDQVTLNLATLEREQVRGVPKPKAKPYTLAVPVDWSKPEGEVVVLTFEDPAEIDFNILMRMEETPQRFFRATLDEAGFQRMMLALETPGAMPGWRMQAILQSYQDYHGLDAQGNVRGSRP